MFNKTFKSECGQYAAKIVSAREILCGGDGFFVYCEEAKARLYLLTTYEYFNDRYIQVGEQPFHHSIKDKAIAAALAWTSLELEKVA